MDGQQLEPGGLNAIVLPFSDEVREMKAPDNADDVKTEGILLLCMTYERHKNKVRGQRQKRRAGDVENTQREATASCVDCTLLRYAC